MPIHITVISHKSLRQSTANYGIKRHLIIGTYCLTIGKCIDQNLKIIKIAVASEVSNTICKIGEWVMYALLITKTLLLTDKIL